MACYVEGVEYVEAVEGIELCLRTLHNTVAMRIISARASLTFFESRVCFFLLLNAVRTLGTTSGNALWVGTKPPVRGSYVWLTSV